MPVSSQISVVAVIDGVNGTTTTSKSIPMLLIVQNDHFEVVELVNKIDFRLSLNEPVLEDYDAVAAHRYDLA